MNLIHTMLVLLMTIAGMALPARAALEPASLEVAGVQLGMTLDEARNVLKKADPALQFKGIIRTRDKTEYGFEAFHRRDIPKDVAAKYPNSDQREFDHFVVLTSRAGKVVFVGRAYGLAVGAPRMRLDEIKQALVEKYGPSSMLGNAATQLARPFWHYDRSGKLYVAVGPAGHFGGPCSKPAPLVKSVSPDVRWWHWGWGAPIPQTTDLSPTCGQIIDTSIRHTDDGFSSTYAVSISDIATQYDEALAEKMADQADLQKRISDEAKVSPKPKL